jgi:hypothetical protein
MEQPTKKRRWYLAPLWWGAALFLILEEWVWNKLKAGMAVIARLPVFAALERWMARLPPYAALAVFALPSLVLLPAKLLGLYFLSHGKVLAGVAVAVIAKLIGTALVARIFTVTKPALMQLGWFARLHDRVNGWIGSAKAWVRALPAYLRVRATVASLRSSLKAWWKGSKA